MKGLPHEAAQNPAIRELLPEMAEIIRRLDGAPSSTPVCGDGIGYTRSAYARRLAKLGTAVSRLLSKQVQWCGFCRDWHPPAAFSKGQTWCRAGFATRTHLLRVGRWADFIARGVLPREGVERSRRSLEIQRACGGCGVLYTQRLLEHVVVEGLACPTCGVSTATPPPPPAARKRRKT